MEQNTQITKTSVDKLKAVLNTESVQEQFRNALQENSGPFVASVIDLYGSDEYLKQCDANQVVMEALKAATLKLPINKQLGFAYIVPYKSKGQQVPQFQLGYKGYIQLAMRTAQYKYLNAGMVFEGVEVKQDLLTGSITFSGQPTSDKIIGYFAHMELLNGFTKSVYMTKEEVTKHAKRYSKSYGYDTSAWKTNFDEMAQKTTLRKLLSHYGIMSTEMISAFTSDKEDDAEARVSNEVSMEANQDVIDVKPNEVTVEETEQKGPGF